MPTNDERDEMIDLDQPATKRDVRDLGVELHRDFDALGVPALRHEMRQEFQKMAERVDRVTERVDRVTERVDRVTERVDTVTERVDTVTERVDSMLGRIDRLGLRFEVVAEDFKSQFNNLHDWAKTRTERVEGRLDGIESDHRPRLDSLELRATQLETRRRPARRR